MRLTDALIAKERYRGEPFADESGREQWPACVLWDDEVQGLGVRIYPPHRGRPSRKDFIVTWRVGLKSRTMGIGTFGAGCTLRQARRTAREALDLARRGRDPIEERQQALGIGTTEDLASRFLFEHTVAKKKAAVVTEPAPAEGPPPGAAEGSAPAPEGASASAEATEEGWVAVAAESAADPEPSAEPPPSATAALALSVTAEPATPAPSPAVSTPLPDPPAAADQAEADERLAGGDGDAAVSAPAPVTDAAGRAQASPAPGTHHLRPGRPTKMRLLPISDALYREIERRARQARTTMTSYLQELMDRDGAAPDEVFAELEARQTDLVKAAGDPSVKNVKK